MMKIVILDAYTANPGDLDWGGLEELGELSVYDRTPENEILSRIGDAEIVLTNKTPLARGTMAKCPNLRYIGVMATGYNVVDTAAAKELGIAVTNVPSYGTRSVSQTAIAMLLEICHHYQAHSDAVFAGEWCASPDFSFWKFPLIELAGKTMGVVGFGRIGQATAKIAEALGMNILACDAYKNPALVTETCRYAELDEVLCESDVIALHCPLLPSTRGMINRENLAKMKKSAILINASRGELVVEQDLADALNGGVIYHAAVDVISEEPMRPGNPLLKAKNLFISPHIAGACKEARIKRVSISAENVRQFLGGTPVNLV